MDEDCDPSTIRGEGEADADGDGFIDSSCVNERSDGTENRGGDCDDTLRGVNPAAMELCNAIDDNCDGAIDEPGAFCPSGICVDSRCRSSSWEYTYGSGRTDGPFGLAVDASGNVYAGIVLHGTGADLDRDGTLEPRGTYVVSVDAVGRTRWVAALDLEGDRFAVTADDANLAVFSGDRIEYLDTADGSPDGSTMLSIPGRWDGVDLVDGARVGDELVVAAQLTASDAGGATVESAILLLRYDAARSEVDRRIIELADELVEVSDVDGSRRYLSLLGTTSAPLTLGATELPAGQFLAVLDRSLSIEWAVASEHAFRVSVSDDGQAAAVGTFPAPWSPPWTSDTYDEYPGGSSPNDAFVVSFDDSGGHLWTRVHSGPDYDSFRGVSYDGRDNLFVSGAFTGEMDVAPRGTLGEPDSCRGFYALWGVTDGDRFTLDAWEILGTSCVGVSAVAVDAFGGMVVLGSFAGTVTLPSGTMYTALGRGSDLFLFRVSEVDL